MEKIKPEGLRKKILKFEIFRLLTGFWFLETIKNPTWVSVLGNLWVFWTLKNTMTGKVESNHSWKHFFDSVGLSRFWCQDVNRGRLSFIHFRKWKVFGCDLDKRNDTISFWEYDLEIRKEQNKNSISPDFSNYQKSDASIKQNVSQ